MMDPPYRHAVSKTWGLRLLAIAMMACLCLATTGATASDGFYVGFGAGLLFPEDSDSRAQPSETYSSPFDGTTTYDRGTAFSGLIGYRFAEEVRVEGELSYRSSDFDEITVREPGSLAVLLPPNLRQDPAALDALKGTHPADGDLSSVSLMVDLYYDFDLGSRWKPYVGAGIGLSRISMTGYSSTGQQTTDDDDTVFAYRVGGGLGYKFGGATDRPIIISLDFRHYATADPTFKGSVTGTPFDTEVGGYYVGVGFRFGL